jgi:hypothetical protein
VVVVVAEARSAATLLAVPVGKASAVGSFMQLQVLVIVNVNEIVIVYCDSIKKTLSET